MQHGKCSHCGINNGHSIKQPKPKSHAQKNEHISKKNEKMNRMITV